jgi:2-methylisocitrate lyase-like PEP mutase family enzyme
LRKRLAKDDILVLPCPYDAISARLSAEAGFEAIFLGGYATAASRFAYPDVGLVTATEMLEAARSIVPAAGVPVIVDGDTGYGGHLNIRRTVHNLAQIGAAAVMIEDQESPKRCGHLPGKQVVDRVEAVSRIQAAVKAREETGERILILARTDARDVLGLDEALWRIEAFADAGADILFLESPADETEMEAFTGISNRPKLANMLEGGKTPILPPERLQVLGFSVVAYPVTLLGAATFAVREALAAIKEGKTFENRMSHKELLALNGYES